MIDRLEARTAALLDWAATPWRQAALITLVALAVILPGLAALPVTDRDEARFAQASKQMLETGDLIDIRFQDRPRWKKPVGIYWLQAASARMFGGGADAGIWAYRLPSALAALLVALLTCWAARPMIGPRGAVLAGLMAVTTLLLAAEANIAKTDAALCATAIAALGALAHLVFGRGGTVTALVFWLAIAISILIKGPVVPMIAAFAVVVLALRPDTRPALARLRWGIGLALTAALVAPWLIAIWQVSDGAFFAESLGRDMAGKLAEGQEKHWGPPGLYLGLVWLTLWPWAAALPGTVAAFWQQRKAARIVFIAGWVVPFWIVLEAVPTKLPHYVLPLYPALVIAAAGRITAGTSPPRALRRLGAALTALPPALVAIALTGGAGFIAWTQAAQSIRPLDDTAPPWTAAILALVAAAAAILAARAFLRARMLAHASGAVVSAVLLYGALLQFGLPRLAFVFPSPAMAQSLAQYRPCASGPAFSVGYHEPSLVFLTETGIRMADPEGAMKALANDPGAMVLITKRWERILQDIPPSVPRATFRYFNYNRGKTETATLLTRDDPRWSACTP